MSGSRLYAAYGSNLHLTQMAVRCPTAEVVGDSEIAGFELIFRGDDRGIYATIEPLVGSSVPVRIWRINPHDEHVLDEYERYPELYRKDVFELDLAGETVAAMVYVMNDGYELGMPAESYLRTIEKGYEVAGFPADLLAQAIKKSTRFPPEQ